MPSRTETTLLTVQAPFNYFMSDRSMCRTPRVVGLDAGNKILWAPKQIPDRPKLRYSLKRVQEIAIPSDELFHERLLGFFATYLAEDSGGHEKNFNCHLFGRWMVGAALISPEDDTEGPDDVIAQKIRTTVLEHGQRGVIGGFWFGRRPDPTHSVIGLDYDHILHVDGWQGAMRITSPENAINKYVSPAHQASQIYQAGIYVTGQEF